MRFPPPVDLKVKLSLRRPSNTSRKCRPCKTPNTMKSQSLWLISQITATYHFSSSRLNRKECCTPRKSRQLAPNALKIPSPVSKVLMTRTRRCPTTFLTTLQACTTLLRVVTMHRKNIWWWCPRKSIRSLFKWCRTSCSLQPRFTKKPTSIKQNKI